MGFRNRDPPTPLRWLREGELSARICAGEMETSRTGVFTQMAPLAAGTEMGNLFHAKATHLARNPRPLVVAAV